MALDILMINGNEIEVCLIDGLDGYYLAKLKDWNKEVASELAKQDNIILGEDHWSVICKFRDYDNTYQCIPNNGVFKKVITSACGLTYQRIMLLFPKGNRQIGRIAGISPPTGYGNEIL